MSPFTLLAAFISSSRQYEQESGEAFRLKLNETGIFQLSVITLKLLIFTTEVSKAGVWTVAWECGREGGRRWSRPKKSINTQKEAQRKTRPRYESSASSIILSGQGVGAGNNSNKSVLSFHFRNTGFTEYPLRCVTNRRRNAKSLNGCEEYLRTGFIWGLVHT